MTQKNETALRAKIFSAIEPALTDAIDVPLRVSNSRVILPIVGEDGEEGYASIEVSILRPRRKGDPLDPWQMAEDFLYDEQVKKDKKEGREVKKKKIEAIADAKRREIPPAIAELRRRKAEQRPNE